MLVYNQYKLYKDEGVDRQEKKAVLNGVILMKIDIIS